MRFTDNASIESSAMMTDDILAGTDVSEGADKKFTLANLGAWFLENFNGTIGGKSQSVLNAIESKADAAGVSEELTAGTAGQLLSESYEENFEPYKFRKSPYTDRLSESIIGASVVWNQLADNAHPPTSRSGMTIQATDGGFTIDGTASTSTSTTGWFQLGSNDERYLSMSGHKVLVAFNLLSGTATAAEGATYATRFRLVSNTDYVYLGTAKIVAPTLDSSNTSSLGITKGAVFTDAKFSLLVFDLTQMFGSTVADALYNMGDEGVKLFRSWYPNDYYPYTTPTLEHVYGLQSHDMTVGDKTYSYALDASLTLRGLIKYDATKGFYADGDTYAPDGTVTRKYGIVDLGTLSWALHSSYPSTFYATVSDKKGGNDNILCAHYINGGLFANYASLEEMHVYSSNSTTLSRIAVKDSSYTDAASFKAAMSGVYLVYELDTPTTESAEPFDEIQITDGTEEYVTDCVPPVGHESKYYANLRSKIEGLPTDFSAIICATEATNKASKNYAVGDYLIYNNTLYKVTTAIASDATLTVGTNITATTIMAEIKALQ